MSDAHTPGRSLGGRFTEATHPVLERINRSVETDKRLWSQDIAGSRAHAAMLAVVGLISADEAAAIDAGLVAVREELAEGRFVFLPSDEDIHMAVERRLGEVIGAPARKLHTGRSRNDQVMTDMMLWCREACAELSADLRRYATALVDRAAQGVEVPMPSFTHLQPAQVSSVAQWMLHHGVEAERHLRRVGDLAARIDACPLGSGASAGGYLPLDRDHTAAALGFSHPSPNSVAATGSRGDLLDLLGVLAQIGVSLSRLGEELVIFSNPAWRFVRLPDRLTTGSSLLPQKRNPDGAELLRAAGKLPAADFAALASVCAGLVGGYSKDLQYDKELLFRSYDRVRELLDLATVHVEALTWDAAKMAAACTPDLAALWLADRLVLAGMAFREAHHLVGLASRRSSDAGVALADGLVAALEEVPRPDGDALVAELRAMTPAALLAGLRTAGGAGPESTRAQVVWLRARLGG